MSEHDIAVGAVGIPNVASLAKKPPHLVTLIDGKKTQLFISLDKPELLNGFIQVKGFYSEGTDEEISKNYINIISSTPKENYMEVFFPVHRVHNIKNLVFKSK